MADLITQSHEANANSDKTEHDHLIERVSRVTDKIHARVDIKKAEALAARAARVSNPKVKVILLREMTDVLHKATDKLVPCKIGCNSCCDMPLMIGPEEAAQIAQQTGARLSSPPLSLSPVPVHQGVPCTFLKGGKCSIYANRPFACRIHYALDDPALCKVVPGEAGKSPNLYVDVYDKAYVRVFNSGRHPSMMQYADIRDFFPSGLSR
jgi:Fe-S-cluster containining protein